MSTADDRPKFSHFLFKFLEIQIFIAVFGSSMKSDFQRVQTSLVFVQLVLRQLLWFWKKYCQFSNFLNTKIMASVRKKKKKKTML